MWPIHIGSSFAGVFGLQIRVSRVAGAWGGCVGVAASGRYDLRDQIEFGSGQSRLDVQQRLDNKNFFS